MRERQAHPAAMGIKEVTSAIQPVRGAVE
jgi:hypothetical protein